MKIIVRHIFSEQRAELYSNDLDETITVQLFGKEKEVIDMSLNNQDAYGGGHVGGDLGLSMMLLIIFSEIRLRKETLRLFKIHMRAIKWLRPRRIEKTRQEKSLKCTE